MPKKGDFCLDDSNYKLTIRSKAGFVEAIPYSRIIRVIEIPGGSNEGGIFCA